MKLSICIATYNGAKYIEEQMRSILSEIKQDDEIIIMDDCSTDNTIELIKRMNDNRIKIHTNEINKGPTLAFDKAISLTNGNIIFMSDQDDI